LQDYIDATKGIAVATVVSVVGALLCPESAGTSCLLAVGAMSGFAGACVTDCSNAETVGLATIFGFIAPDGGGAASEAEIRAGLANLQPGRRDPVAVVENEQQGQALFDVWSRGGKATVNATDARGVTRIEYSLPDGTLVQIRSSSRSGGATLDITFPNSGGFAKVHVQ
jgi:hypothetical protein